MGQLFDTDEHPGSEFQVKVRQRVLNEEWKKPEHQKDFKVPLNEWRRNESKENIDDFRKRYHFDLKNLVTLENVDKWSEVGWKRPNYGPTQHFKAPVLYTKKIEEKKKEEKKDTPTTSKKDPTKYIQEQIPKIEPNEELNKIISLFKGDICKMEVDGIQNAANSGCMGGGGIDGAIHSGAGPTLERECATLNGCKLGRCRITKGYDLPSKYVLHTVGPMEEDPESLASCYTTTLKQAMKHHLKTVALCRVSTGIFGYPSERAGHLSLLVVRKFLLENNNYKNFDRIIFVVFGNHDEKLFNELMPVYFPLKDPKGEIPDDPSLNSYEESKINHEQQMIRLLKECIRDIHKIKEEYKDDEEKLQNQILKVEAYFAKRVGFGKGYKWTFVKEETDEEKTIRLEKEKEEERKQAIEDHEVCVAYGLYDEKKIEMYLPESEEEIIEREKKEKRMAELKAEEEERKKKLEQEKKSE
eukprot:gene11092-3799_t